MEEKNIEDLSVDGLKETLFNVYEVTTQKALAKATGISPSTLSRIFSEDKHDYKNGPTYDTINKIASSLTEEFHDTEEKIFEHVCELLLHDQNSITEYMEKYQKEHTSHQEENEQTDCLQEEELNTAYDDQSEGEGGMQNSSEVYQNTKAIIQQIGYEIIEENPNSDGTVLFDVKVGNRICYTYEKAISLILGGQLLEDNYQQMTHRIMQLNTEDGFIILFCKMDMWEKAAKDPLLRVENNVLLYNISVVSKILVKSHRKGEKKFLQFLFGKDKLQFLKN